MLLLHPHRGAKYCDHCLCVTVCSRISVYMLPVAMAWFSSDNSAVFYVLPVLWMTSCFDVMEQNTDTGLQSSSSKLFTMTRQVAPLNCTCGAMSATLDYLVAVVFLVVKSCWLENGLNYFCIAWCDKYRAQGAPQKYLHRLP